MTIHDACDFILTKATEEGSSLNFLKLQKLVYYAQAWHLAIHRQPLFQGRFQAWIHGPVNRELFDRFKGRKQLYSAMELGDVRSGFDLGQISNEKARFLDSILETYAGLTGSQLEEMTHNEDPWIQARKGYRPSERCEVELSEELMGRFYRSRLSSPTSSTSP